MKRSVACLLGWEPTPEDWAALEAAVREATASPGWSHALLAEVHRTYSQEELDNAYRRARALLRERQA
jgi:hypothetical protein